MALKINFSTWANQFCRISTDEYIFKTFFSNYRYSVPEVNSSRFNPSDLHRSPVHRPIHYSLLSEVYICVRVNSENLHTCSFMSLTYASEAFAGIGFILRPISPLTLKELLLTDDSVVANKLSLRIKAFMGYAHKTSGFIMFGFITSGFQNVRFENVLTSKYFKTFRFTMYNIATKLRIKTGKKNYDNILVYLGGQRNTEQKDYEAILVGRGGHYLVKIFTRLYFTIHVLWESCCWFERRSSLLTRNKRGGVLLQSCPQAIVKTEAK
jgi:hypothetical protein